jgi:hypothetical protein
MGAADIRRLEKVQFKVLDELEYCAKIASLRYMTGFTQRHPIYHVLRGH